MSNIIESKVSPNNGILFNSILRPKLLKHRFITCSFINPDLLLPHTAYFYNNTVLSFLVFKTFEFILFYSLNNKLHVL